MSSIRLTNAIREQIAKNSLTKSGIVAALEALQVNRHRVARDARVFAFGGAEKTAKVDKAYDKLEEEGFVTTIHGKGTYVTASDKQLALEARQREAEADFEKAIDRALAMGMSREDILETVTLLLEEK